MSTKNTEKLKDISKIMYGYTAKSSTDYIGPKYLRITDIQNGFVRWDNVPNCEINQEDFEKYSLNPGDIVFARTGATTGKSYLIKNPPESVFASYLIRVQINEDIVLPEFLYKFFQSDNFWATISLGTTGSAQGGFNAKKLGDLKIPILPKSKQIEIIKHLDNAFSKIDRARLITEDKLVKLEELKRSILQKTLKEN